MERQNRTRVEAFNTALAISSGTFGIDKKGKSGSIQEGLRKDNNCTSLSSYLQ